METRLKWRCTVLLNPCDLDVGYHFVGAVTMAKIDFEKVSGCPILVEGGPGKAKRGRCLIWYQLGVN